MHNVCKESKLNKCVGKNNSALNTYRKTKINKSNCFIEINKLKK